MTGNPEADRGPNACWPELHDAIAGLSEKHRAPVVLCYLEGLTTEAAAQKLGCPQGTVLSRLSRAREKLRQRLARGGLAVPAGLWAAGPHPLEAPAAVPAALANATIQSAIQHGAGPVAAAAFPAAVSVLAEPIVRTMLMTKIKMSALALLTVGLAAAGALAFVRREPGSQMPRETSRAEHDNEEIQGTWKVISAHDNGRPVPKQATGGKQTDGMTLHITSDTFTIRVGDEIQARGTYTLDPAKQPKWIDLTDKTGRPTPGIYNLWSDGLIICYNEAGTDRPTRFASEPNPPDPQAPRTPNDVLLVLERAVPSAKDPDAPPSLKKASGPRDIPFHLLEFRIAADWKHDQRAAMHAHGLDGLAMPLPGYRWVRLDDRQEARYDDAVVREEDKDKATARKYLLVKLDPNDINETDLALVYKAEDQRQAPAIGLRFKPDGGRRLGELTGSHLPEEGGKIRRRLAIIIEGVAIAAPSINAAIRDDVLIEIGDKFPSPAEFDRLIKRLADAVTRGAGSTPK